MAMPLQPVEKLTDVPPEVVAAFRDALDRVTAALEPGRPRPPPDVTAVRLAMLKNGYAVIPVTSPDHPSHRALPPGKAGKAPIMRAWNSRTAENTTPEMVRGWATLPHQGNTGICCGKVIAVDVDVSDARLAARVVRLVGSTLGRTPLQRIGRAPKTLLLFRAIVPIPKQAWPTTASGDAPRIEVLSKGQQFVASGVHPGTRQPYRWIGFTPEDVPYHDLPLVGPEQIATFMEEIKRLFPTSLGVAGDATATTATTPDDATDQGDHFFTRVNRHALTHRDAWVPALFPTARKEAGTGAWRVTSDDIGRDLEEDLSIHADGIRDFGTERSLSPIDVVFEHADDDFLMPRDAALWLCEQIDVEPESLGYRRERAIVSEGWRDRFHMLSMSDAADAEPPRWLVADLLPEGTVAVLFGEPGAGKSLVSLTLGVSVASGRDFAGRSVRQGPVLYMAAEDSGSILRRVSALREDVGDCPAFFVLTGKSGAIDLRERASPDAQSLLAAVHEVRPVLVVVDTLPAATPGADENKGEQMGEAFAVLGAVAASGAVVVALTHSSKADATRPRGHTSQLATAATAIQVRKEPDGNVRASLTKARDADPNQVLTFRVVVRGLCDRNGTPRMDNKGKPVTAVVAVALSDDEARASWTGPRLSPAQVVARDALMEGFLASDGAGLSDADWRAACQERGLSGATNLKDRRDAIGRAIRDLAAKGLARRHGDRWWPVTPGNADPDDLLDDMGTG
ncbi:AAA family ATPase [Roseomonas xinghualingensis]|uniref:AAA family ATPase n=1 Tax=Roseomonas xinghualingensis TaxID=2986475 RepID=UPI0021F101B1|nr:AAA family ATPase [Roseomonas sp. SXEYE001]MCV4209448.1 AAA family ATPase [Roseomonas sp. SXEYE001]